MAQQAREVVLPSSAEVLLPVSQQDRSSSEKASKTSSLEKRTQRQGMDRYVKGGTLGQGTFGVVYQAEDRETGLVVAIKKIRLGKYKEGVNVTALREIKLLKELHHGNVIRLVDVFPHKRNLNLVFEYMESDLETVIKDRSIVLSPADVKSYLFMTLKALAFCHSNWVLHRDLKPNNLLIARDGSLKLADFGLARIFGTPDRKYTNQVFARWYRAPELLFGAKAYGGAVDIWAAGCVLAELILRRPFVAGNSDIDQLGKIFSALGTPSEQQWPGMKALPDYVPFVPCQAPPLRQIFTSCTEDVLDLLLRMLTFNPNGRITAAEALEHRYFSNPPAPTPHARLPRPPARTAPKPTYAIGSPSMQEKPPQEHVVVVGGVHVTDVSSPKSPAHKIRRLTYPPESAMHLEVQVPASSISARDVTMGVTPQVSMTGSRDIKATPASSVAAMSMDPPDADARRYINNIGSEDRNTLKRKINMDIYAPVDEHATS
eukprot:jgi/Chlat1/931/Chrsp108S00040